MLGDNLSMISDTTIAATQSLGTDLKDKFKINLYCFSSCIIYFTVLLSWLKPDITAVPIKN
jgi:Na+/H+ antiporter NhaC